jgi:selenocysteine lyase/cysteine desulfurase
LGYALELGLPSIEARVRLLARLYRDRLASIAGGECCDLGANPCGIVTFRKAGEHPSVTVARLDQAGISASVSAHPWGALGFGTHGISLQSIT